MSKSPNNPDPKFTKSNKTKPGPKSLEQRLHSEVTTFKFQMSTRQYDWIFSQASKYNMSGAEYVRRTLGFHMLLNHPEVLESIQLPQHLLKELDDMNTVTFTMIMDRLLVDDELVEEAVNKWHELADL